MVEFREIKEENFREIIRLKVSEPQQKFVAAVPYSLAQAWLYYENHDVFPYGIYADNVAVGFIMFDVDDEEREAAIWRLLIDERYQHKGYGKETMKLALEWIKKSGKYDKAVLDYVPENVVAKHLYESFGFLPTGEVSEGEIVMAFQLK